MNQTSLLQAMQRRLETAGIPYHDVRVFGKIRINVHVRCHSRDTADRWVRVLVQTFKGARVSCTPTSWKAMKNKNTATWPTMRHGWLIVVSA